MTVAVKDKNKRPDTPISELVADAKKSHKKGVDKHSISMKAADGDGTASGIMAPNAEQLAKINQFTRSAKSADDVVVFKTYSCNDMYDRDDERFRTSCVDRFAKLEGPLSPIGKSFMVSHDYSKLPRGRIFDAGTETSQGVRFLTNEVYIPKIEDNKSFIENVDAGVYWAVSVGVTVETAECSICKSQMFNGWFGSFCEGGHEKGLWYDPKSEELDDWGFLAPADPESKNAVKCRTDLDDPIDFYELSMCFLGAQYMAELGKQPGFKGIMKAATKGAVPIIGLSAKEASSMPLPASPDKLSVARDKYSVTTDDEGNQKWTDDDGLVWLFDPEEGEVFCLGKAESSGEDDEDEDEDDTAVVTVPEDEESDDDEDEDEDVEDKTPVTTGKATIDLSTMRKMKLPADMVQAVEDAIGNATGATPTEILRAVGEWATTLKGELDEAAPLIKVGRDRLKELRTEVISWYVRANKTTDDPRVSTKTLEKMLDRIGDDPEILNSLIADHKSAAQAKFPQAVRRSTFPDNPNSVQDPSSDPVEPAKEVSGHSTVSRIHS